MEPPRETSIAETARDRPEGKTDTLYEIEFDDSSLENVFRCCCRRKEVVQPKGRLALTGKRFC